MYSRVQKIAFMFISLANRQAQDVVFVMHDNGPLYSIDNWAPQHKTPNGKKINITP